MDFLMSLFKRYWLLILNGILLLALIATTSYCLLEKEEAIECSPVALMVEEDEEIDENIYVDLKGAVKNPGVYEMTSASIINDVITKAGGFTSKAYKNNLNLSKRISDEMVIYVYTKTEYAELNKKTDVSSSCSNNTIYIDSCVSSGSSIITTNDSIIKEEVQNEESSDSNEITKISINTATKEELMTLSGVGEAKAESIIQYRNENGGFKNIEEIKNVSGIGETAYEKIKDYITI